MYEVFLTLPKEKQKKIINAGMKEFAAKGYVYASTNRIVADAEISKGSLFHYFGSKEGLFAFLCQYGMDLFRERIAAKADCLSEDIFERWKEVTMLKIQLIGSYPLVFEFFFRMLQEDISEVQIPIIKLQQDFYEEFREKLYRGVDYSIFKDGIDVPRALKLIWWGLEGYAKEVQTKVMENGNHFTEITEETLEEMVLYLEQLKIAFTR